MSKRKAEQPHPDDEQARSASRRRSTRLLTSSSSCSSSVTVSDEVHTSLVEGTAAEEQQRPAAAVASTGAPFRGLDTVELRLIMQHCDLSTLLALARCSRFALSAASHPFAWRALPPLSFPTTVGANLRGSRLLVHCDMALRWVSAATTRIQPDVKNAELAAIESVPRLVELDTRARKVKSAELRRLLSHPALAGLTTLRGDTRQMDDSCTALLPLHQPRLRTLSLQMFRDSDADPRFLAPLAQLPALTDLSLDDSGIDESVVDIIGRCASLRRLHLSQVEPAALFAVLAAPARARLESLSLRSVSAGPYLPFGVTTAADGTEMIAASVDSWKASFENLQSLRALSLQHRGSLDVVFAGAAAALASGTALRSLTALRADTLKMDNEGGSLIPLLAAHCPQLSRLHIHVFGGRFRYSPGALTALPSLSGLKDLRLQFDTSWPPKDDELAVGRCASLTRLHLNAISHDSLNSVLRSPQLQRLESLTLESVHFDEHDGSDGPNASLSIDWSACFANLRSLRALNLDDCYGGDLLLAGVQAACPPLLRTMRFRHTGGMSGPGIVPKLQLLPALLAQIPALRVELIKEAPPADPMAYRCIDMTGRLPELHKAWDELKRKHPERVTVTVLHWDNGDPLGSWSD